MLRHHSTVPVAIGEVFNSIWDCNRLIEEELIDFIRVAVIYAGGITHVRRIVDLAELHHVKMRVDQARQHDATFPVEQIIDVARAIVVPVVNRLHAPAIVDEERGETVDIAFFVDPHARPSEWLGPF